MLLIRHTIHRPPSLSALHFWGWGGCCAVHRGSAGPTACTAGTYADAGKATCSSCLGLAVREKRAERRKGEGGGE